MNALFSHGRPKRAQLCAIELPIEAAFVGRRVHTTRQQSIQVQLRETDNTERVLLLEQHD
jgi:pyrimidine operon attenuation protein / uracil phosphoribosyltransferase